MHPLKKCLVVKLGAIGDVAMVIPAARQLHMAGYEIHWLCGNTVFPLLKCYRWIHPIEVNDRRLFGGSKISSVLELIQVWRRLFWSKYDLCATLQYDSRYKLLGLSTRSTKKISLDRRSRALNLISERSHSSEYARVLCQIEDRFNPLNQEPVPPDQLPPNPFARKTEKARIALVPGGARNFVRDSPQRRWPISFYVDLSKLLLQKGFEVVLTGGPGDEWVSKEFDDLPVVDCIGMWAVDSTVAFYDSCDVVVTHDTGPLHLAGLVSCGIVALFGPTTPWKFMPRRKGVVALWGGERLACRPCYDTVHFADCDNNMCMQAIPAERVIEAVQHVLRNRTRDWSVALL
jgi:heptosyltransferase-2